MPRRLGPIAWLLTWLALATSAVAPLTVPILTAAPVVAAVTALAAGAPAQAQTSAQNLDRANRFGAPIFEVWVTCCESGATGRGLYTATDERSQHPRVYQYIASCLNFSAASSAFGTAIRPRVCKSTTGYITKSEYPIWSPDYGLGIDGPITVGSGSSQQFYKWQAPIRAFADGEADSLLTTYGPGRAVLICPVGFGGTTGQFGSTRWAIGGDLRVRAKTLMLDCLAKAREINSNSYVGGILINFNVNDAIAATNPQAAAYGTYEGFVAALIPELRTVIGFEEAPVIYNDVPPEAKAFDGTVDGRNVRMRQLMASTVRALLALAPLPSGYHRIGYGYAPGRSGGASTDAGDHLHQNRTGNNAMAAIDLAVYGRILKPPQITIDWSTTSWDGGATYFDQIVGGLNVSVGAVPTTQASPSGSTNFRALTTKSLTAATDIMQIQVEGIDPALDADWYLDIAPVWTVAGYWQVTLAAQPGTTSVVALTNYGLQGLAFFADETLGVYSLYVNGGVLRTLLGTCSLTPTSGRWWRYARATNGDLILRYSPDGSDSSWTTCTTANDLTYTTGGAAIAQLAATAATTQSIPLIRFGHIEPETTYP